MEMRKLIYPVLAAAAALIVACTPDYPAPKEEGETETPLTSVTAYVSLNGYNDLEFVGYPDENNRVEILFPYYFPEESDDEVMILALTDVKVIANLANNVILLDKISRLDLTKENKVRLVDQTKKELLYTITGRIARSSATEISDVKLSIKIDEETTVNYSCVIKGDEIIIPSEDELGPGKLTFRLSPHATLYMGNKKINSGDTVNLNEPVQFRIVADDGTERICSVHKGAPEKLDMGINTSENWIKYLFSKKLKDDVGIGVDNLTTSLAVSGDYLLINTRGEDIVVLDRFTGAKVKTIALPAECKGDLRNFCITNDDEGHIFICNYVMWTYGDPEAGTEGHWTDLGVLKIWKMDNVDSATVEYISWPISDENFALVFGRRISVRGSVSGDAIITIPCNTYPSTSSFYRWTVRDGAVDSTPEWITVNGGYGWNTNIDIAYLTPDPDSDFITFGYSDTARSMTWWNGKTFNAKTSLELVDVNYVPNALDILEFNGVKYVAATQLNSFTWGRCDFAWLLNANLETNFTGSLNNQATMGLSADCPAIEWSDITGQWGPHALGLNFDGYANANHHADIVLAGSESGYYMYLYFMFCNGYVVGVQFDCIDRGDA